MVGSKGKLVVSTPNRNFMSMDKDPTLQSCKITHNIAKLRVFSESQPGKSMLDNALFSIDNTQLSLVCFKVFHSFFL